MAGNKDKDPVDSSLVDATKSIDLSNPYFMHHSDHPGLVLISKPLNGDNYAAWKRATSMALNPKNKLGFVDGSIKPPSEKTDPGGYTTWSRCNDMVHSWIINTLTPKIINTLTPEITDSVIYYTIASEVWEDLLERFSQSNAPRIFEIQCEICYLRQDQLSIAAYYTKLKGLWDELISYNDGYICTYGAQQERQKLMQFLMGLNESYSAIRGQLLLMNPLPSVRQAYSSLCQEEKHRAIGASQITDDLNTGVAMAVKSNKSFNSSNPSNRQYNGVQGGGRSDQGRRRNGSSKGRLQCTHCGSMGRSIDTCYALHGYPPGHPKAKFNCSKGDFGSLVNQVTTTFGSS